jgi:hypothetical protein
MTPVKYIMTLHIALLKSGAVGQLLQKGKGSWGGGNSFCRQLQGSLKELVRESVGCLLQRSNWSGGHLGQIIFNM